MPTPPLSNSASWLFTPSTQPTTNPSSSRMYALKENSEIVKNERLTSDMDDDKYKWKYNNDYDYLKNE